MYTPQDIGENNSPLLIERVKDDLGGEKATDGRCIHVIAFTVVSLSCSSWRRGEGSNFVIWLTNKKTATNCFFYYYSASKQIRQTGGVSFIGYFLSFKTWRQCELLSVKETDK
jgi:hypothetical protein